ncbi:hypothetical protein AN642_02120, partial [Epulopiscium sp. SCG-B10WGA-EpuloA2]
MKNKKFIASVLTLLALTPAQIAQAIQDDTLMDTLYFDFNIVKDKNLILEEHVYALPNEKDEYELEQVVEYFYDNNGNKIKEVKNDNYITVYDYNENNDLIKIQEIIDNTIFHSKEYSNDGYLIKESNEQFIVDYIYDNYNMLSDIICTNIKTGEVEKQYYQILFSFENEDNLTLEQKDKLNKSFYNNLSKIYKEYCVPNLHSENFVEADDYIEFIQYCDDGKIYARAKYSFKAESEEECALQTIKTFEFNSQNQLIEDCVVMQDVVYTHYNYRADGKIDSLSQSYDNFIDTYYTFKY